MSKSIPCRKAFTNKLIELAAGNQDIIVVTSDARGSVTLNEYADKYPEQFVEVGIAEQNEVGIAAGIASFGKQVFVCAPACFLSARSLEQIKVDVVYSKNNVKIVGISGGISYGALGFTHQSLHDIAVMRTFPDLAVILPADRFQTEAVTEWLAKADCPAYVRVGRAAVPDVYSKADGSFTLGKANILKNGSDVTAIAAGEMVAKALAAADMLFSKGISVRVLDMHTIKPLDRDAIVAAARETGAIVTLEEHSIFGGLGAAVAEVAAEEYPVPMRILGIPDEIPVEGEAVDVFRHYGLTPGGIAGEIQKLITRKK
ncbi:MAG: transketolase family protein [Spirochaetes bacterium]|nr:transketolase family protein [Spirochaetota bacterium]MBL7005716.1 transketolase family protein [Spirochaetia bacterium]